MSNSPPGYLISNLSDDNITGANGGHMGQRCPGDTNTEAIAGQHTA